MDADERRYESGATEADIVHPVSPSEDTIVISFREGGNARAFLGTGWSYQEPDHIWMEGDESALTLRLPKSGLDCEIQIDMWPHVVPSVLEAQHLELFANGVRIGACAVTGPGVMTTRLPAALTGESKLDFLFCHPNGVAPITYGKSDSRPLSLCVTEIRISTVERATTIKDPGGSQSTGSLGMEARHEAKITQAISKPKPATETMSIGPEDPAYQRIRLVLDRLSNLPNQDPRRELFLAYFGLLNGQSEEARRHSLSFVQSNWQFIIESPEVLNLLGELNFLLRDFTSLRAFVTLSYGVACDIVLKPKKSTSGGPGVAKWLLGGSGPTIFIFDSAIYDHPFMSVIVKHWIQSLPIYCRFKAASDLREGDVFLNLEDMGTVGGITFCDFREEYSLIPDPIFMQTRGYANAKIGFDNSGISWSQRRDQAIWRGTTTGWFDCEGKRIGSWRDLPRVKLCMLANDHNRASMIDAGLTGLAQINPDGAAQELHALGLHKPYMNSSEFQQYKYQIDIDGNSNAWPGLFIKLCTASVVFKVASSIGFRQWYYDRLVPWYNFVPVESDMSDLFDKISWIRKRDDLAETIGRNGRSLAASMTPSSETLLAEMSILHAFTRGQPEYTPRS
jgi:hypothetical protein